jgi:hypothetical protein
MYNCTDCEFRREEERKSSSSSGSGGARLFGMFPKVFGSVALPDGGREREIRHGGGSQ